jgi:hypothetical protein
LQEIKIPILASEKRLLDEANGGEEPDGDASGKKDEKPKEGGGRGCLRMGRMPLNLGIRARRL